MNLEVGPLHHLVVVFLVLIFPLWDRRETRRLKTSDDPDVRVRSYQKTIGWLWAATVFLFLTTPPSLFMNPPTAAWLADMKWRLPALLGVSIALLTGIAAPAVLARRSPENRAAQIRQLSSIAFFLPRTRVERWWFAAVSISAGVCEELIFRGFLIRYFDAILPVLGLAGAILAAAIVFGVDHGYQGRKGVAVTAALALIFTLLFFLAGSLWVPMAIHAALDLRLLLILEETPTSGHP